MEIVLFIYLVANIFSLICFCLDKYYAIKHKPRISERFLLISAAIGGIGALIGMYSVHHKTKKLKFVVSVPTLCIIQLLVLRLLAKNY